MKYILQNKIKEYGVKKEQSVWAGPHGVEKLRELPHGPWRQNSHLGRRLSTLIPTCESPPSAPQCCDCRHTPPSLADQLLFILPLSLNKSATLDFKPSHTCSRIHIYLLVKIAAPYYGFRITSSIILIGLRSHYSKIWHLRLLNILRPAWDI